jgi:hypothetical protein
VRGEVALLNLMINFTYRAHSARRSIFPRTAGVAKNQNFSNQPM